MPTVSDVCQVQGPDATGTAPSQLLIEIPHGATTRADYDRVRAQLRGPLPDGLEAFFHVNTDEGAPELGQAIAQAVVAARPDWRVTAVRCRIPRTFIDTNRVIDSDAVARGDVTPGLQPYIVDPDDQALLRGMHATYQALCDEHFAAVCGSGGLAFVPHTYAPRSVGIERVDEHIVEALHRVYAPEMADSWPLRAPIDLITTDPEGTFLAADLIPGLRRDLMALDLQVAEGDTYTLHPATMSAARAAAWPGQTLCWEVRRDLLTEAWRPFTESTIDPGRVQPIADAFARAAVAWLER